MSEMDERIREKFDWHSYPYAVLGVALVAGFVVGRMIKPRRTPADRLAETLTSRSWLSPLTQPSTQRSGLMKAAGAALAAVAVRSAGEYVRTRFSQDGFQGKDPLAEPLDTDSQRAAGAARYPH